MVSVNLSDIFAEIERQGITLTLYGVRYQYSDQYTQEDYLYPVAFTNREKAQGWIDNHSIMRNYLSVEKIKLNPDPGVE